MTDLRVAIGQQSLHVTTFNRPQLQLKVLPRYPASINAASPLILTPVNGGYNFTFDAEAGAASIEPFLTSTGPTPSDVNPIMDGVAVPGVATVYSRGDHVHPTDTSRAPLASPTFTGDPKAPTPTVGDNDTSIATTAFVAAAITASGGVTPSALSRVNDTNITLTLGGTPATALLQATSITVGWLGTLAAARGGFGADVSAQSGVPLFAAGVPTFTGSTGTGNFARAADPVFTGNPTAPTPAVDDNDFSLATTAFVIGQASAVGDGTPAMDGAAARGTAIHWTRADHVHPTDTSRAPLASPVFTGNPTGPTPAVDDNDFSLATTAYVIAQASAAGDGTPAMNGTAARGTAIHWARADHIHPVDTSRQPLDAELTAIAGLTSAADQAPYFTGSGAAALMTVTPAARTVLDDLSVAAMLTTLGGQPLDAELTALAGLVSAADQVPYFTGVGTASLMTVTAAARTVLDDTTVAAMLTTLGGQPLDTELTALAGLVSAADQAPYFTGSGTASLMTITAAARTVLDDTTVGAMLTTLGGQPSDAELTAIAGLVSAADRLPYFTGSGTASLATYTASARTFDALNAVQGDLFYGSATDVVSKLAKDANATRYLANTGASNSPAWGQINLANGVTGVLPNANLANMAAYTFKGNNSGSAAAPGDVDIAGLTAKASPVGTDLLLISDQAASGAWKKITITSLPFGVGDVVGPAASVDGEVVLFNSTTGKLIKRATGTGITKITSGVQAVAAAGTEYMHPGTTSLLTVGFTVTPNNIGTVSTGTTTPNPALGNYQYYTNNGAHTLAAPASDCAMDILITNGATSGAITFSGFTVAAGNTGDALTTVNTSKFIISIRRINAIATYTIKALQ